jgi:hypothetical protein
VEIMASIEDPGDIEQVLEHREQRARQPPLFSGTLARTPPQMELPGFED